LCCIVCYKDIVLYYIIIYIYIRGYKIIYTFLSLILKKKKFDEYITFSLL